MRRPGMPCREVLAVADGIHRFRTVLPGSRGVGRLGSLTRTITRCPRPSTCSSRPELPTGCSASAPPEPSREELDSFRALDPHCLAGLLPGKTVAVVIHGPWATRPHRRRALRRLTRTPDRPS